MSAQELIVISGILAEKELKLNGVLFMPHRLRREGCLIRY
jgi:hypothetical protein